MAFLLDEGAPPILLHFDVNRTIVQVDSIQAASASDGVREGIAELYWGRTFKEGDDLVWEWTGDQPSCTPPDRDHNGEEIVTYSEFCKTTIKDKKERKAASRDFRFVRDEKTKEMMLDAVKGTLSKMQLDPSLLEAWHEMGMQGDLLSVFPSVFKLVAKLQESKRPFAILFRSFGGDHKKVETEWNAFCEMRHPVYSHFLKDIGPLDGSVPGVPDRRCNACHTVYRDADGILLVLDCNTNGPETCSWDSWAKAKDPKPTTDTREGRSYIRDVLGARTEDGIPAIRRWTSELLARQGTAAFKDDWAWWTYHKETAPAGKPMVLLPCGADQHFFDDNVEFHDARIVDCRDADFKPVPQSYALGRYYTKASPVEAVLDDDYFLNHLNSSQALVRGDGKVITRSSTLNLTGMKWLMQRLFFPIGLAAGFGWLWSAFHRSHK